MTAEIWAAAAVSYRDVLKFLRDRTRIVATFVFPVIFVIVLGQSFNTGANFGFDFRTFVFIGVLGQTVFQSAALGIISLIEDRESDFSQEIFVAPISRYTIIGGKIGGESLVALVQGLFILLFGFLIGVPLGLGQLAAMLPAAVAACLFGGAFGLVVMANLGSQRSANQVFPFLIFPQFFLAGVFNPIAEFGPVLSLLSILSPMRYPIDLLRGIYYLGDPAYDAIVLWPPPVNAAIMIVLTVVLVAVGTTLFVRRERNR